MSEEKSVSNATTSLSKGPGEMVCVESEDQQSLTDVMLMKANPQHPLTDQFIDKAPENLLKDLMKALRDQNGQLDGRNKKLSADISELYVAQIELSRKYMELLDQNKARHEEYCDLCRKNITICKEYTALWDQNKARHVEYCELCREHIKICKGYTALLDQHNELLEKHNKNTEFSLDCIEKLKRTEQALINAENESVKAELAMVRAEGRTKLVQLKLDESEERAARAEYKLARLKESLQQGNEASDSSASSAEEDEEQLPKSSSSAATSAMRELPGPTCWADLEDPRRNGSSEGKLPWKEAMSTLGTLDGDAKPLCERKTGSVMRKTFGGVDMVIKLFEPEKNAKYINATRMRELENEAKMYESLKQLQDDVIPRFFGLRDLLVLGVHVLCTEYKGTAFDTYKAITKEMRESALEGLKRMHDEGVIHGDVKDLSNVLWEETTSRAVWIDLGLSVKKHIGKTKKAWARQCQEECKQFTNAIEEHHSNKEEEEDVKIAEGASTSTQPTKTEEESAPPPKRTRRSSKKDEEVEEGATPNAM